MVDRWQVDQNPNLDLKNYTGLIGSKYFHNYAYQWVYFFENFEIVAISTDKIFFNGHTYKVDIGQHFC